MAITNGYATLAEFKSYVDQGGQVTVGSGDDPEMESAIEDASRDVDAFCNRRFYLDSGVSARVYIAETPTLLKVHDFSTTTGLLVKVDTTGSGTFDLTWSSSDYQPEPLNGVVEGIEGWPFWLLRAIDDETFPIDPTGRARVQVTAKWGWAAVPKSIYTATLIQALANFKRKDVPHGVAGFDEYGAVRVPGDLDRAAAAKAAPYRRGDMVRAV